MIQPAFDIGSVDESEDNSSLLIEVSEQFLNYIIYNNESGHLSCIRQYPIESSHHKAIHERLQEIFTSDRFLQQPMKRTVILYNFPESSLVPEKFFDSRFNDSLTRFFYGTARKGVVLSDSVEGWDMYNVYRVPAEIHTFFQQRFNEGKYWHYYTLLLTSVKQEDLPEGQLMKIVFYNDKFIVSFFPTGN